MKIIAPILLLNFIVISCSSNPVKQEEKIIPTGQKQFLLTNEISFGNRPLVLGASSFLLQLNDAVYLCTAKHLTGEAVGFEPTINLKTYGDSIGYWLAFPRTPQLSSDTIQTGALLHSGNNAEDVILLQVTNKTGGIGVLKPTFNRLKNGDRVRVLGCEYADTDCYQKEFFGTFQRYTEDNYLEIVMDSSNIQFAGMSGAPVVDHQLNVVGILVGGSTEQDGSMKIYLTDIALVKKIKR